MNEPVRSIFDEVVRCHLEVDDEEFDECMRAALKRVDSHRAEALEVGAALASPDWAMRAARADVLGEVCNGHPEYVDDVLPLLRSMSIDETHVEVIISIAEALGHAWDPRASPILIRWVDHPDESVRRQVAGALLGCVGDESDSDVVQALVRLTTDPDARVRDMATFALGVSEASGPGVLEALMARIDDVDPDARAEAFMGLAKRGDLRIVARLIEVLESGTLGTLEVEAAGELADPRLHPALLALSTWWGDDRRDILDTAIRRCDPASVTTTDLSDRRPG